MSDDGDQRLFDFCYALWRNDASITRVWTDFTNLSQGYGVLLGHALLDNDFVTFLSLDISTLLSADATNMDEAQLLVRYIRSSPSLQHVSLVTGDVHELSRGLIDMILDALAETPNLNSLDAQVEVSAQHLANLLRGTRTLTRLNFHVNGFDVPFKQLLVALALGANQTLEELSVGCYCDGDYDNDAAIAILQQLYLMPNLRDLMMSPGSSVNHRQFEAMAQFLRSTTTLQHFHLFRYRLGIEAIQQICPALQSNPVITKFSLAGCHVDEEGTNELVRFMQDKRTGEVVEPLVQELHIRPVVTAVLFGESTIGQAVAEMVQYSSVQVLGVGDGMNPDADATSLFNSLTANASHVALPTLQLALMTRNDVDAMNVYLPVTATLQKLSVAKINRCCNARKVLAAIRQNGSLREVDMKYTVGTDEVYDNFDFFRGEKLMRLNAYLERNQALLLLLAKPRLYDGNDDDDENDNGNQDSTGETGVDQGNEVEQEANNERASGSTRTELTQFPDLVSLCMPHEWLLTGC